MIVLFITSKYLTFSVHYYKLLFFVSNMHII